MKENLSHRNYATIGMLMVVASLLWMTYMCTSMVHLTKHYQQTTCRVEASN